MTRRQWSGNAHSIIRGIGLVSCVYVNAKLEQFWVIDYRIFDPASDGKSKLDHMQEMLSSIRERQIPFRTVRMDSWYATKEMMMLVENWNQNPSSTPSSPQNLAKELFYCPLKSNRKVDDSGASRPYRPVGELEWSQSELEEGKIIKIHGFAKEVKVKLFRVEVSSHRTDYIVTNDLTQNSAHETRKVCAVRWKIEQYHRELKQLTGIESCQCRKARIQRNHIHCALLVWTRLKASARQAQTTPYQIKHNLFKEFLIQQLKRPTLAMMDA